jgi:hypothetical protein
MEEATWLSPTVIVPKKNGKLKICIDFKKLNIATKKDPHPLSFTNEMLNTIAIGYTPYQLVYGLHPLMPIKYIVLVVSENEKDNTLVRVLTSRITKLEKL